LVNGAVIDAVQCPDSSNLLRAINANVLGGIGICGTKKECGNASDRCCGEEHGDRDGLHS